MRNGIAIASLVAFAALGCVSPFDLLGEEEIVTESTSATPPDAITDDRIEDKHPVCDPSITITETFGACRMTLDKSCAVTTLDVVPFADGDDGLDGRVYATYAKAAGALGSREILPSMEVVNATLKPFDDGLYAAVELGAEDGSSGSPIDKRALWNGLLAELAARSTGGTAAEKPLAGAAAAQIAAAIELSGGTPVAPPSVLSEASGLVTTFRADAIHDRPIGFYTWSSELSGIFERDRFLQSPASVAPTFGAFAATAVALNGAPDLANRYGALLDLYAGLTNPSYDRSVRDLLPLAPDATALADVASIRNAFAAAHPETQGTADCAAGLSFAPASDSPETRLFRMLYCDGGLSPDQNLIDVLVSRVRAGTIDLTPRADSGFYDRQLYALETLLVPDAAPEKDHLFLTKRYKEKLVETFKTILTENRETHVKQLDTSGDVSSSGTIAPVDLYPLLPVEPFPTFYLRTARAYAFVKTLLQTTMGDAFLSTASRVFEGGARSSSPLGKDLDDHICLLYGLHEVASASIGMRRQTSNEEDAAYDPSACEERARSWLRDWRTDGDAGRDPRVIVPVHIDDDAQTVRYWAVVGVGALHIEASFYPGREPKVASGGCPLGNWVAHSPYLLVGKQVEITLPKSRPPPTRGEFRAICDAHRNVADIVAALEGK